MIDKENYEYLKTLDPRWWESFDTIMSIALILNREDIFSGEDNYSSVDNCIDYFEKPYKWQGEINKLIKEYEKENIILPQCKLCKLFEDGICELYDDDFQKDCKDKIIKEEVK